MIIIPPIFNCESKEAGGSSEAAVTIILSKVPAAVSHALRQLI